MASATAESNTAIIEPPLLPADRESQVFWRLRWSIFRTSLADKLRHARLRVSLIVGLSLFFWIGLYVLFFEGFRFLSAELEIVQALYNAFFASLSIMLVFSTGIILYSGLYRSRESSYLLTLPARAERIFVYKFQEATWFSSWGFVLMASPMLVAYGVAANAGWQYYAAMLPFMISFVFIPAGVGALLCLAIVNWLPRLRVHAIVFVALSVLGFIIWVGYNLASDNEFDMMTPRWFQDISERLKFTERRLLPSSWLSAGLLEASRPGVEEHDGYEPWAESLLYLTVLIANAMLLHQAAMLVAGKVYRTSYSRLQSEFTSRRRIGVSLVDELVSACTKFLPRQMGLLLVKEMRLVRRDPVQWMQFLIFFGLLGLYFLNIRRFTYNASYSVMIGFLNLAVVGLILSTFTTRFIFPMISLEGRRFWILGLLPVDRDTIFWSKFVFAAVGSLLPCGLLILLSDLMLDLSTEVILLHQLTCWTLCAGLSGIAVGLGALMPDLQEDSPSKIAAGFGGTLNLVLSAAYIIVVVMLTAAPYQLMLADEHHLIDSLSGTFLKFVGSRAGVATGAGLSVLVGAIATVWPIRAGLKAFRELEF